MQGGGLKEEQLGEGGRRFVLRETGADSLENLMHRMQMISEAASDTIERILKGET